MANNKDLTRAEHEVDTITTEKIPVPHLIEDENGNLIIDLDSRGQEYRKQVIQWFGTDCSYLFKGLVNQMLQLKDFNNYTLEQKNQRFVSLLAFMKHIGPQDALEAMLAAQMIGIHEAAMHTMASKKPEDVNCSIKLSRTFVTQMDALNKHRGKGQQKMTVEHVYVGEGGQAVIGNVNQGGGNGRKK